MHDDSDAFRDLAWRALENPADATLRAEVAAALAANPVLAEEWRRLRGTHALAREAVPAALARAQADRTEIIPAHRLEALTRQVQPRPRPSPWWFAAAAALALLAGGFAWSLRAPAEADRLAWSRRSPASLARALTAPLAEVSANATLPTLRNDATQQLRSPILAATAGPVRIVWTSPTETPASVTLREGNRTLWTVADASSPVATPVLPPGHVYELTLATPGGAVLRETFVTVTPPDSVGPGLEGIFAAVTAEPARLGEAVLAWHDLPVRQRHGETATRLGLWLGVQARQPDLLAEATSAAAALAR